MPADLVAIRLPPGEAFLDVWERTWAAGDAILPLAHDATDSQAADLVARFRPTAVVTPRPDAPGRTRVIRLAEADPVADDIAMVVPTSGSTGRPRGAELSHRAIEAAVSLSIDRLGGRAGDRWLSCLPWNHLAGLLTVLRSHAAGVDPLVHERFDLRKVGEAVGDCSFVSLVPTQLIRLLDAGVDLSGLRAVLLGGGPMPSGLPARAEAAGITVVASYGMTETCGGCVYDGLPLDGVQVRADPRDHRLAVSGPILLDRYRNEPAPAVVDGWFMTGDRGEVTPEGRVLVHGRVDDMIITGGENVSAERVAARLVEHPAVADAAVIGVPDPEWGSRIAAVVVATDPSSPPTLAELRVHVQATLGSHAAPSRLADVPRIPRSALGKPERAALQQLFDLP